MDDSEIYRAFVSKLEKSVIQDAKRYRGDEARAKQIADVGRRKRGLMDVKFCGTRDHKKMVSAYNDAICVLAEITGQKPVELKPKYYSK